MKNYLRIISFIKPYRRHVILSILFNVLMVVFSLVSVAALIPILQIIFNDTREVLEPMKYQGIGNLRSWLEHQMNYGITLWIQEHGKKGVLLRVLGFAVGLFFLKNLFRYLGSVYLSILKNGVEKDIRNAIYDKLINLHLGFFSERKKGDIMARLTTDINEIQWAVLSSVKRMVQDPLMIILTLVVLFVFSYKLTLFVLVLIPLTGFIITSIGKSLKRPSETAKEELGTLMSYIEETITGLPVIKSYLAENKTKLNFIKTNNNYFRAMNSMLRRRELSSPMSEMLGFLVICAIIWYGGYLILTNGELEPAVFITYIAMFYQIINPAKSLSVAVYDINRGDASAKRILELLDTDNPIADDPQAQSVNDLDRSIDFDDVYFSYEKEQVIKGVSFRIDKGDTVALVGQSGSGKSTLALLLNRFYDVDRGSIRVDGVDIRSYRQDNLRKLFAYIPQEAWLFNDTVRSNVKLGRGSATDEDVWEALRLAHADGFIRRMEGGLDTNIGDRGDKLSGGQKQRLSIARAILKNPPVMVLDEATSSLDSESEKLVQQALDKVMEGRTALVIAHRLSTIQDADRIVVLRDGEIVEVGTHEELLAIEGEYSRFVQLQAI